MGQNDTTAPLWETKTYQPIPDPGPSRRERIATAALQGLLAGDVYGDDIAAKKAVKIADALIAELDGDS